MLPKPNVLGVDCLKTHPWGREFEAKDGKIDGGTESSSQAKAPFSPIGTPWLEITPTRSKTTRDELLSVQRWVRGRLAAPLLICQLAALVLSWSCCAFWFHKLPCEPDFAVGGGGCSARWREYISKIKLIWWIWWSFFARSPDLTMLTFVVDAFDAHRLALWMPPRTAATARAVSRCGRSFRSALHQLSRRLWSLPRAFQASSRSVSKTKWCFSKQALSRSVINCVSNCDMVGCILHPGKLNPA